MKMTPEELKKWIKGVPVNHDEEEDDLCDIYGLDKDDCLGRTYPGVADKDELGK
jgi:hypothetical protein